MDTEGNENAGAERNPFTRPAFHFTPPIRINYANWFAAGHEGGLLCIARVRLWPSHSEGQEIGQTKEYLPQRRRKVGHQRWSRQHFLWYHWKVQSVVWNSLGHHFYRYKVLKIRLQVTCKTHTMYTRCKRQGIVKVPLTLSHRTRRLHRRGLASTVSAAWRSIDTRNRHEYDLPKNGTRIIHLILWIKQVSSLNTSLNISYDLSSRHEAKCYITFFTQRFYRCNCLINV